MTSIADTSLSLYRLLDPEILSDPYPLYDRLRSTDPVHWDPYLHAWVVTRYADVIEVLHRFSAACVASPEQIAAMGMAELSPIAEVMCRQMLFLDPPAHDRVRYLAAKGFTPRRVDALRGHIEDITDRLLDSVAGRGSMDLIADFANPLPAIVSAEMLGVPPADHRQLKAWSEDFGELLGNFQYNADRTWRALRSLEEMSAYFGRALRDHVCRNGEGLVDTFSGAHGVEGRLTEEEVVANLILTMVGGQETTTNLIGNGVLTLLRHRDQLERLRLDPTLLRSAIEELLRFESPSQQTRRMAVADVELGGKSIRRGQTVITVMGAANRDPERFPDPDVLDIGREDNRHVAFGWANHFCFGAPLARLEAHIAFGALLSRLPEMTLATDELEWRPNLGLRGLVSLPVTF
ncbi:MAG: cytochrome P450 [Candidatus Dormibacteraeota bacterium]|nr:cytochrome P450 [Candidatus Dormibacteraeota bacterium]